jgi:ligand-binding sensor domain-containing protein/signal transduction histidine kinase
MHLLTLFRRARTGIILVCLVNSSHALDPNRLLSQYIRERWSIENEFPGGTIHAISQTPDGYLWIGTDTGLIRFDGFNFREIPLSPLVTNAKTPVLGLTTDVEGNLLIQLQGAGVLRQKSGRLETVSTGTTPEASQVTDMLREQNGEVLIADLSWGIVRLLREKVEALPLPKAGQGLPVVISMATTPDGKIWFGTLSAGLFLMSYGEAINVSAGLPFKKINCLLAISDHELWVGTDGGVFRWDGARFTRLVLPRSIQDVQVLSLLKDRDANVWIGTAMGLARVNSKGVSLWDKKDFGGEGVINALFEDREGNLWAGGNRGIERIRDTAFITYSSADGLSPENNGPVYTDEENRTWFAPAEGGLYQLKGGKAEPVRIAGLEKDVIYSIAGRNGEIWVGRQHGGMTRLRYKKGLWTSQTYTVRDGLAQNSVYAVYKSSGGVTWAGTVNGGVSQLKDGRFTTYTTASGVASNTINSILESHDGTIWLATPNGVTSLSAEHWRSYSSRNGLPSDIVNCLFEDSSRVLWIGTANGLASLSSANIRPIREAPDSLHKQILGMAEDKSGWLWIATSNHVLRVRPEKLMTGKVEESDVREFGLADGLGSTEGVKRSSSVVTDSLGHIWISTTHGLSVVDPVHLAGDSPAAIIHLTAISADGRSINIGNSIRIPSSHKRVTFNYTGLSLAVPERIRFRYFLDGFDRNWSDPTSAREAPYTNLGAGPYRFRVIASNSDGIWNGSESTTPFEVDPAFWQTWWFRSMVVLTAAVLTRLAYRYRVRQVTSRLDMQFQERFSERTRIAGELHDTFLQSVQGLILHFQGARNLLPANPEEAVHRLDVALERAEQAIVEGRNAIHDIRSSAVDDGDLEQALSALGDELRPVDGKDSGALRVLVEGVAKPLRPIVRDDIYRIVREALRNAFRHAQAQHIEAEIVYEEKLFRVRIRDDGRGIDSNILTRGEPAGHWGLVGMRERAQRIGGQLDVWSEHKAGTEVELTVPGSIAYSQSPARAGFQLFRRKTNRSA